MSLKLRIYGDPVLREKAAPVGEITDEIKALADQLIEMMLKYDGIGIAATQCGVMLRMFATSVYPDLDDGSPSYGEPYVLINPVIRNPSDDFTEMDEGCLSIPKLYTGPVPRPYEIDFEALDIQGNQIKETNTGFLARHRMHEVDHLNGVLFIDRIKGKKRRLLEPELRRIKQNNR